MRKLIIECLEEVGISLDKELVCTGQDLNLQEYIIDSIVYINFIVALEEKLGYEVPDEVLLYDKLLSMNAFLKMLEEVKE